MTARPGLIETKQQLLEWIAGYGAEHQQSGPQACGCGWSGTVSGTPWSEHFDAMLLTDLGDVLASDDVEPDGREIAWRRLVQRLYRRIDHLQGRSPGP